MICSDSAGKNTSDYAVVWNGIPSTEGWVWEEIAGLGIATEATLIA